MKAYSLTVKIASQNAWNQLNELDKTFIGTPDYMGLAYFWNYEYRHYLRDASATKRKLVHDAFLDAGFDVVDHSDEHEEIIKKILKVK